MPECIHGNEINKFCYQLNCPHASIGGCSMCFQSTTSSKHRHQIITAEELDQILKKCAFPRKVKPQCTDLQKAYFDYYQKLKEQVEQLPNAIDTILKTMVNKIGFPYIYSKNHFNTFKRIKNCDYSRVNPEEFHYFVQETKQISIPQITKQQEKLYFEITQQFFKMLNNIHRSMESFQIVISTCAPTSKFKHHKEPFQKIRKIMEKIHITNSQKKGMNTPTSNQEDKKQASSYDSSYQRHRIKPPALNLHKTMYQNQSSEGNYEKSEHSKNTSFPYDKVNMHKNQSNQVNPTVESNATAGKRIRRNSIDTQLFQQNKLATKVDQLRKKEKQQKSMATQKNEEEEETPPASSQIKNNNLPEGYDFKESKVIEKVQVKPVTRKLEQNHIDFDRGLQQVGSPLIKNKIKHQNSLKGSSNSNNNSPYMVDSPDKNYGKGEKRGGVIIRPKKIQVSLPPLNEKQENSLILLTSSLKQDTKQAIPYLEKALVECPNNLSAAQYLSFLYLEDKRPKKCIQLCQSFLQRISGNSDLFQAELLLSNNKAASLNLLGRYSQTVKFLEVLPQKNQLAFKNLANAFYGLGKFDDAIPFYKKALQQCNDDEAFYNLSGCLYLKEHYQSAKNAIHSALASNPKKYEYLELQSHILKKLKEK